MIGFSDDSCSDEIDITLTELQQYGVDISWGTRVYNSVLVDVTPFSQSVEIEKLYGPSPKQLVSLNLDTSATYTLVTNIDEPTFIAKYNSWVQGDGAGIFYKDEIYQINIYHNITGSDNYYNFYLTGKLPANPLVDRAYSISMNGNMNTVLAAAQEWGITFTSSSTKVNDTLAVTPEYGCSAKLIYESAKES